MVKPINNFHVASQGWTFFPLENVAKLDLWQERNQQSKVVNHLQHMIRPTLARFKENWQAIQDWKCMCI